MIHQNALQKFPKRTYSAQLTVTVGLNDILKSNQADYIMHQNMVKWYSFAAMLKEHLIFLRRNKAELSKYRQVKKEHERINGNFCSSYWCGKPCNTSESFPEAKGECSDLALGEWKTLYHYRIRLFLFVCLFS